MPLYIARKRANQMELKLIFSAIQEQKKNQMYPSRLFVETRRALQEQGNVLAFLDSGNSSLISP